MAAGLGGNVEAKTTILAHETVLNRMIANKEIAPDGWPTETFFGDDKEIFFNGEGIVVLHQPAAQTDGDAAAVTAHPAVPNRMTLTAVSP